MFFKKDYFTPGPGVDPNEPEKTGFACFWELLELGYAKLFQLNLLFLVSCIPVVTIPIAIFAMNQVVRYMILRQPVDCVYHYRAFFRRYWKNAYGAFFLVAGVLVVSGYGLCFYLSGAAENPLLFVPFMLCSTIFLAALLASPYLYGMLSTGAEFKVSLRMALTLGIGKPGRATLAVLSGYGLLFAAALALPISGIYLLLIGFSFSCFLSNFYIRTVLREFCRDQAPPLY